jgi:trimeric autotransporter adhesin
MNKMLLQLFSATNRTLFAFLLVLISSAISVSYAQTNVALTATPAHSGGGGTGTPDYSAVNYNDGFIAPNSAVCASTVTPWGWVNNNGSISFTWSSAVTFDKVVFYKSNRPMNSCTFEYWNGLAYVPFYTYTSGTCTEDSVSFPPVTTTILRFNNVISSPANPNHREIQVWSTPTVTCTTPANQPTALVLTPGIYTTSGAFTAATSAPERYLTIMTTSSTPPAAPVDGVNYSIGSSALGGVIVGNGTSTTFTTSGLTPATQYWYWVYSVNAFCIGGPVYQTASPLTGTITTNTCGLSGTRVVGPTGDYTTIAAAITAINNGGLIGPMVLEIQTSYAGEALPITIGELPCVSAVNTVTIRPQGVLNLLTTAGADMIILDGAKHMIIDGRVGSTGTTKSMTIANQSTIGNVFRFINGASNNTIRYCSIQGENTSATNGTIFFGTSTAATGNSNNTIDNCDIMDDGIFTPVHGVLSVGTVGKENSGNTVSNCNIANYYQSGVSSKGIFLSTASTNWTINNNRFYQTSSRVYGSSLAHNAISVVNTSGNGFSITNNIIGFSSSTGTGIYAMSSSTTATFQGILMSVGTGAASTVQGNTMTNFNYSGTSGLLTGISVTAGNVNVTGNTIGATTGTGAIIKTNTVTSSPAMVGISTTAASPAVVNIQNNNIGSITVNGSSTTIGAGVYGISATSTATTTITGNVIGSTSTANSINSSTVSTGTQLVYGILASISSTTLASPVISNNIIANISAAGTGTGSLAAGILFNSTSSGIITNNVIRNISSSTTNTVLTGQVGISGIAYTGGTGSAIISLNTINTLIASNTGSVVSNVAGIALTGTVNGVLSRNRIYDIRNLSTGVTATTPPKAIGIFSYSPGTSVTIINNMISLGNAQTTNTSFTGIMQGGISSAATIKIYYNTINIEGVSGSGTLPSVGILRGNYSATAYTTPFEVLNNIVNNTRGGLGKHYAIANNINGIGTNTGWGTNASNYNILNANPANVGYWVADMNFAAWQVASSGDLNSYSGTPVTFASTVLGDLHINMGITPNNAESHGIIIPGVNTDFDNQIRPGPIGSVNGGAISPDLGADEFDGVPIDNLPPVITYGVLVGSCGTGDRTFSATIGDYSGVPTTGVLRPRVYFKKSTGATWFSQPGTLITGTANIGTWNFTIVSADMGGLSLGETVEYYVLAQDNLAQIGSVPSAGLVATDVNNVSTHPTAPNSYMTLFTLNGSYSVGVGGDFTTLTEAVNSYNAACLSGPVTFNLTDASYSSGEIFPITINVNPFAGSVNTLTIKPAAGNNAIITGSSASILKVNGAKYITIDGSNNGTTSQNLTIENTSTTASSVIWNASLGGLGNGASDNTYRNLIVKAGIGTLANVFGIVSSSTTLATTAGDDNNNLTIRNCSISKCYIGVNILGTTTAPHSGLLLTQNNIGSDDPADYITDFGLQMSNVVSPMISQNVVFNIKTVASLNVAGINVGANVNGGRITRNKITGIYSTSTGGWGAYGINLAAAGVSNLMIDNNMISDLQTVNYVSSTTFNAFGIRLATATADVKIYHNSVHLSGNVTLGTNTGSISAAFLMTTASSNLDVRNNIFRNTQSFTSTGSNVYSMYLSSAGLSFGTINNNTYSGSTVSPTTYNVGFGGAVINTFANWQTFTGQDVNSNNAPVSFISESDLHLQLVGVNVPLISGTPIPGVNNDFDGTSRSLTTPVIGAHEVSIPNCSAAMAGVATPGVSSFCVSGITTITALGSSAGIGTSYQWQASPDSASWTAIAGATSINYTLPTAITSTTFYRVVVGCSFSSTFDSSTAKITVNPNPASITGSNMMCINSSYLLASASPSGAWTSSAPTIAAINALTGDVTTGAGGGTATITYSFITGCRATTIVTVNSVLPVVTATSLPSVICAGESTGLNGTTNNPGATSYTVSSISYSPVSFAPTGTFNSTTTPSTGTNDDGFYNVTLPFGFEFYGVNYPAGTTCHIGTNGWITFLSGRTNTYINTMPNAAFPPTISLFGRDMIISTTGSITYGTTGTAPNRQFIVSYNNVPDFSTGLIENGQMVLYETSGYIEFHIDTAQPSQHTLGIQSNTGTFFATVPGQNNSSTPISNGAWRFVLPQPVYTWSADPALSATDILNPTAGPISGTTTFTLSVTASNGCVASATTTVSVNPLPAPIAGTAEVCEGLTTTLTNADGGGTWSSANTAIATVNTTTGVVTGVMAGTTNMNYTFTATGCTRPVTITVNALPDVIAGTAQVCEAATTTLTNATTGGTWSSSNTATATIGLGSGLVNGIAAGTSIITYTLPTSCISTRTVSVNPLPLLTVTPVTPTALCIGESTSAYTAAATMPGFSLLNQNFNTSLGAWTIENLLGAAPGHWQIVPSGFDGTTGDGSPMLQASPMASGGQVHTRLVSPSFSTVGFGVVTLSFNHYIISDVADAIASVQYSTDGGTVWNNLASYQNTFTGTGIWSIATPDVSLSLPMDAINQANVKIRWNYDASFYGWFVDNIKVDATLPAATYTWSGGSDLSCTTCTNPTITPAATGANIYTVTATSSASCISEATATVNVNPLPAVITSSSFEVCEGLTTTLASADGGGTWTSSNTSVATVNSSTGVVTGQSFGTAAITYTLPTGCIRTAVVTVNALPAAITGTMQVCEGLTTTLSSAPTGGTWSSSNTNASVDGAGVVTGNTFGTATITYTLPSSCIRTAIVTVNALPAAISGTQEVCVGLTTTLTSAPTGGTWTSSSTGRASVGASSGIVTGVAAGNAMITYMLSTGCIRSAEVTVNALPAVITGTMQVCEGLTTTLSSAPTGGNWSSSNTNASVDGAGVVTGSTFGTATITYQLPVTGCIRTAVVTVNQLPSAITGMLEVCEGLTTTLASTPTGGSWSSSNANASVNVFGIVTGNTFGTATITYVRPVTGCIRTAEVTVNALPSAITGNVEVCEGAAIALGSTPSGGSWTSSNTNASVDASGMVTGNTFGTATITYQLPVTGCIRTAVVTVNQLPSAISGTLEVCEGLTTTLVSTPTGGTWSSSNANASVNSAGVVTGNTFGTATITYERPVTGCIRTAEVTVHALPVAIVGATQVCATSAITLTNADAGGSWSSSNPSVGSVDAVTGVVTGIMAGSVVITYTLPTSCIATHNVAVNALPVVYNVTGGGSYCDFASGVLVGVDNSDIGTTYSLYRGTTFMASQPGVGSSIDFGFMTAADTYTVLATSSASCENAMSGSATVIITPSVIPMVTLGTTPNDTVCAGTSVTFTATSVNGGTAPAYTWTVNGSLVTSTVSTHSYVPLNGDVVVVTMTSNEVCPLPSSVSASQTMVVVSNQTPTVSIAVGPNDTLCQGSTAVYGAVSTFGGSAPVYTWYKNNVSTGVTGSIYSYIPVNGDVISARLNSNYRCPISNNVESNKITMRIDTIFVPVVAITTNTGLSISLNQSVTFTATVSKGGTAPKYQWLKNSTAIAGATNVNYTTSALANNDSVTCVVYGTGDCSYFTFNSVKMKVTTGFEQVSGGAADIRMMPNPNSGDFVINGTLATTTEATVAIDVTNMLGQTVYSNTAVVKGGNLNESVKLNNTLANGMYILSVHSGTESKVFHFVLRK